MPRRGEQHPPRWRTCSSCGWTSYPRSAPDPIVRGHVRPTFAAEWVVPERCDRCGAALAASTAAAAD